VRKLAENGGNTNTREEDSAEEVNLERDLRREQRSFI